MKRTADELRQLLDFEKLSAMRLLDTPKIEKREIPTFIRCPKFEKAKAKADRTIERYQRKVDQLAEKIQQTKSGIASMEKQQAKWSRKASTFLLDRSSPRAVEKQNHAASMANRLLRQISTAAEKHDALIDEHNEAVEEAKEKLEELTQEALVVIDEDIVALLDKCTRIAEKQAGSQNTEDLVSAVEVCVMQLRVFALFEDAIEGNVARKDCRDRITGVNLLFSKLCAKEQVRHYLGDVFRRSTYLVQKNGEVYLELVKVLDSVDQHQLDALTESVVVVLGEEFDRDFAYEGVVDPAELEAIVVKIKNSITVLEGGITKAKEVAATTEPLAEVATNVHKNAQALLASMTSNVEEMEDNLLERGHFACEMIEEAVIDDFYGLDVRPAVEDLRRYLVDSIGEEQVDTLLMVDEDRYALSRAETAIMQANLLRLQAEREKIDGSITGRSDLIGRAQEDLQSAAEVPQQNANMLRAELRTKYLLACIPGIGSLFALGILGRLKTFEPAFRSTDQIYRNLGSDLLVKNRRMTIVLMVLGGLFGVGGAALFFALKLGPDASVNAGVPISILGLYFVAAALLASAGKRLRSYMGISAVSASETSTGEGGSAAV